jgi:hypothetical protein
MVQVDVSGYDFDPQGFDSGGLPAEGKAHLRVAEVSVYDAYCSMKCEILAHEKESEVGKTSYTKFQLSGKGVNRLLTYCKACGVLTKEDVVTFYQEGPQFEIPVEATEGRSFCGTLVHSEWKGKKKCEVQFDFARPGTEEAADYPQDADYLAQHEGIEKSADDQGGDSTPF